MLLELANISSILKEFERDEISFEQDVNDIQAWLKTQAHLPEVMDKQRIKSFLLVNKCRIEKTKKKIDMFYTIRSLLPEFFANPKQPKCQECLETGYYLPLPKLTKNQERVIVFTTRDSTLIKNVDPIQVICCYIYMFEMRLFQDNCYNDIYIFDMKYIPTTYLTKLLQIMPKAYQIWETVWTMRIKKIYIINAHSLVGTLLNLVKTLVKTKLFERIHVIDEQMLIEVIPKEIIPKDFNGEERSMEELRSFFTDDIKKYEKYFDKREHQRVNEKLRVDLINTTLDVYGNFKKLNVD